MVGMSAEHSAGSRPLNKEGGGAGLPKNFFKPFGPQFGLKIMGRGGGRVPQASPLDLPLEHEQGMMGRKKGERAFSPLPSTPFTPTFVNN